MSNLVPAVAYYRMSSDKQETSIADQRTAVEEYANRGGYKIIREYLDEGISGWKAEQRKGFQQLIEDASKRGDFKAVLCWDQDRFSRFPVLEANHYWYLLDRAGVHIATIAQGRLNFEDLGEWLKASVVQHGKAEYVRDLARNTTRGLRKIKLAGRWLGPAPYGYETLDGKLTPGDPSKVATVRRIFDMRQQGYGTCDIAKRLNADGIPSPFGKGWASGGIRAVLSRPTYVGNTVIGRYSTGTYEHVSDKPVTLENTHPAIISKSVWDSVQSTINTTTTTHTRGSSEGAPLAGLLKCGLCGGPMYSLSTKGKYICGTYRAKGTCGCCTIPADPLMAAVASKIRESVLLGSRERLEAAIQKELDKRQSRQPDLANIRKKLATLDKQINRAGDRLLAVDDSLVSDLEQRLMALKRQREQLAETLSPQPSTSRQQSAKAIASKLWELDQILATAPPTAVRHVLRQFIDHIRLDFEPASNSTQRQRFQFIGGEVRLNSSQAYKYPT